MYFITLLLLLLQTENEKLFIVVSALRTFGQRNNE